MSDDNVVVARNTENAPTSSLYAQTAAFSHYNNLAAQLPIDPKSGALVPGGVKSQAKQCFANIEAVAKSIDHTLTDVARITIFLADIEDMDAVDEVYKSFFTTYVPSRTV
ncbi:MAG: RidA family protein, partial [Raoultibacter sp.]